MAQGVRKSIYLEKWMVERIQEIASASGVSFNGSIRSCLALALNDLGELN